MRSRAPWNRSGSEKPRFKKGICSSRSENVSACLLRKASCRILSLSSVARLARPPNSLLASIASGTRARTMLTSSIWRVCARPKSRRPWIRLLPYSLASQRQLIWCCSSWRQASSNANLCRWCQSGVCPGRSTRCAWSAKSTGRRFWRL